MNSLIKYIKSLHYSKFIFLGIIIFILVIIVTFTVRSYLIHQASNIDDQIWEQKYTEAKIKPSYKIVILEPKEDKQNLKMLARRILIASQNMGWEAIIIEEYVGNEKKIKKINPDFIISTLNDHDLNGQKLPYNIYAYFLQSTKTYFGGIVSFSPVFKEKNYKSIDRINGFLCTFKAIKLMKDYKESKGGTFEGFRTYPTVQSTKFEPFEFNSIVYFGSNWDKIRSSNRFKIFFMNLNKEKVLNVYGSKEVWQYIEPSWKGTIDGNGWNIIDITKKYGISLIVHARRYHKEGIPSSRIFESIASSSIVITDNNKFVVDNFQDSVLYFNEENSANAMTEEVLDHIKWIKENPEKARAKAKKAHDIFLKKFTLENELIKIAKMHETILNQSKTLK